MGPAGQRRFYRGAAVETLTIDRLVDDAHELVLWLCREYGRKKVYLLGGSWGSELGTWLAYRYPEHIAAFVGFGQVVNGAKNEELSYQLRWMSPKGRGRKIHRRLKAGGPRSWVFIRAASTG